MYSTSRLITVILFTAAKSRTTLCTGRDEPNNVIASGVFATISALIQERHSSKVPLNLIHSLRFANRLSPELKITRLTFQPKLLSVSCSSEKIGPTGP